ncbi:MAG: nuclear transport factor 2 family protein [Acidimicrobiia bacterium]|jgi:hypothetical protein
MSTDLWVEACVSVNELLARYCHALDAGDRAVLANCFASEASLDVDGRRVASGAAGIVGELAGRASETTMHLTFSPVVRLVPDERRAVSSSYFASVDIRSGLRRSIGLCDDVISLRPGGESVFESRAIEFRWRAGREVGDDAG